MSEAGSSGSSWRRSARRSRSRPRSPRLRRRAAGLALALAAALGAGCGARPDRGATLPPDVIPVPAGRGAAYRLPAISPAVARRAPVGALRCTRAGPGRVYGVHLDLYARRLVLPVPAGIGIAPPQRRSGAYVLGGACTYPIRTYEPSGVVVIDAAAAPPTLTQLFAVWGKPLGARRLAAFRGPVQAFVGGRPWRRPPGEIPLTRHAEIVLEVGGYLPPHPRYRFEPGL